MAIRIPPFWLCPLACCAALLLAGCTAESGIFRSPGGSALSISVEVRDATTGDPISGARVIAETASRDHPFSAASLLGQTTPESSAALTDEHGLARISVIDERDYRIVVWPSGAPPVVFHPLDITAAQPGGWLSPGIPAPAGGPGLEIRILAAHAGR